MGRYDNNARTVWVPHKDLGMVEFVMRRTVFWDRQPYTQRMVVEGAPLDIMAWHEYGVPQDYWRIGDLNPRIVDVVNIDPGSTVYVPLVRVT